MTLEDQRNSRLQWLLLQMYEKHLGGGKQEEALDMMYTTDWGWFSEDSGNSGAIGCIEDFDEEKESRGPGELSRQSTIDLARL